MTKSTTAKETSVVTSIDDAPDTALDKAEAVKEIAVSDVHGTFEGERAELTLHSTEGEVGHQAVFLGINGNGFNIPRDTKVIVPAEVIEALENATMEIHEPVVGGNTKIRNVKRFSYTVKYLPAAK
jgi:hypothetical protein